VRPLPDATLDRLRDAFEAPDLDHPRYRAIERIGRGGMGTVYLAEDLELGRRVALKVLHPGDAGAVERLREEARVLARLEHPGIVPIHDVGTLADGRVFYVMQWVRGRRLDEHVRDTASRGDRLRLFVRLCDAVAFAHAQGIVHRDLKPANVMVGAFGEVYVMDWGLARVAGTIDRRDLRLRPEGTDPGPRVASDRAERRAADPTSSLLTRDGQVVGTPAYMPPEQAAGGAAAADARADVWALGAILRFLLTGVAPGVAPGARQPRALEAIASKAMASNPEARYAGARDMAEDVARWLDGEPVLAHREGLLEKAARVASRHRVAIALVGAYVAARVVLFFAGRG